MDELDGEEIRGEGRRGGQGWKRESVQRKER